MVAGHGIGYGELRGKAAQLAGKDAQFGIVAIEADLDGLSLGREAGALDGNRRAGRGGRWGNGQAGHHRKGEAVRVFRAIASLKLDEVGTVSGFGYGKRDRYSFRVARILTLTYYGVT